MINLLNRLPHIIKFGMVGAFGALLKIGTMYIMTSVIGVFYLFSYAMVYCLSVVSNFTLNTLFTFGGTFQNRGIEVVWRGLRRYSGIALVTLAINECVVYFFTHVLGYHYLVGTVAAVGVAFLFNFTMSKRYVWVT